MNELIPLKQWVVTYLYDKVPLNPYTMRNADVTDAATWADYGTATACVSQDKHLTLGFVLTNSPFSCIDLDTHKTKDAAIIEYHKQIYESCATYSELSPSGGVHVWCRGKLPMDGIHLAKLFVEVYSSRRYMTVTGNVLNGFDRIEDRTQYLDQLVSFVDGKPASYQPVPDAVPASETDDEVCAQAARASNGDLFKELYLGHWEGRYPSQSEADQAFVNIVAFYTDSMEQVARIFRSSQLGRRKKAMRQDYLYDKRYGIVLRAFDQKLPNFYFKDIEAAIQGKMTEAKTEMLKELGKPTPGFEMESKQPDDKLHKLKALPEFIKDEYSPFYNEFPPGLVGDVAKFIYYNAVRPVKEIAVAGAIALMAGITGKLYNISEMGLNHYIAILAPTGTGKEGAASGIEKLINVCKPKVPLIELIIGPQEISSPQALIRHLATISPCCISRHEEMGIWIEKICKKNANENNAGLRAMLLGLYTSSGKGKIYRQTIRADVKKDTPAVCAPAFSLYGDTTPDIFYKALDEEQLDQGLVSRFMIIESEPDKEFMFNEAHDKVPPDPILVKKLVGLMERCLRQLNVPDICIDVQMTKDVHEYFSRFREECDAKRLNDPIGTESIVYSRAHERLLRLSGLVAVGCNPDYPVVTMEIAQWSKKLILRTMASVILRFQQGEVGEVNLWLLQMKALKKIIRNYWKTGYNEKLTAQFNISPDMFNWKLITHNYITNKVRSYPAFRKSRTTVMDLNNCLNDLIKNGVLMRIDMGKVRDSYRTGVAYYIHDFNMLDDNEE